MWIEESPAMNSDPKYTNMYIVNPVNTTKKMRMYVISVMCILQCNMLHSQNDCTGMFTPQGSCASGLVQQLECIYSPGLVNEYMLPFMCITPKQNNADDMMRGMPDMRRKEQLVVHLVIICVSQDVSSSTMNDMNSMTSIQRSRVLHMSAERNECVNCNVTSPTQMMTIDNAIRDIYYDIGTNFINRCLCSKSECYVCEYDDTNDPETMCDSIRWFILYDTIELKGNINKHFTSRLHGPLATAAKGASSFVYITACALAVNTDSQCFVMTTCSRVTKDGLCGDQGDQRFSLAAIQCWFVDRTTLRGVAATVWHCVTYGDLPGSPYGLQGWDKCVTVITRHNRHNRAPQCTVVYSQHEITNSHTMYVWVVKVLYIGCVIVTKHEFYEI